MEFLTTTLLVIAVVLQNVAIGQTQAGTDICSLCFCDKKITPILISCEKQRLTSIFTEADWKITFEKQNLNASEIVLDVRFDENDIVNITKFPTLPIVALSFRRNRLHGIVPYAFENLESLGSLDLSVNEFTARDLPESVFEGKMNKTYYNPLPLQSLNLSHNSIHSLENDLLDHFPRLTSLDLSHNPLKIMGGSTAIALADLLSLEYLNVAYTGISDIPVGLIHTLKELISLDLSGNEFTTMPKELENAHNLTVLILDDNKFESFNNNSFKGLESLQELSISRMKSLRLIEARTFGNMKKLVKFHCCHNRNLDRISNAAFYEIAKTPEEWPIKEMYLNDNALTHIDEALAAWVAIPIIDIQNNPFKCNCMLEWMAEDLVDQIRRGTPELAKNILCSEPKNLKGGSIIELGLEPESFAKCKPGGYNLNGEQIEDERSEDGVHEATATIVLVIGIILIVIGSSIVGVIAVKRRAIASALVAHQEIRYQRADDDEFDQPSRVMYKTSSSPYRI